MIALLVALVVYLPIGLAAVIEERHEQAERMALPLPGFRPGDHRQYKRWIR